MNLQPSTIVDRFWSHVSSGTLAQDWDSLAFKSGTQRPKVGHVSAHFARLACSLTT